MMVHFFPIINIHIGSYNIYIFRGSRYQCKYLPIHSPTITITTSTIIIISIKIIN